MNEQRKRPARRRAVRGEKGYVLALTALMMLPLLAFTGFAVDLGSWYGRAAQIQRGADAAALAGVQDLPNLAVATATAKSVAAQNGFTDGVNGITVTVAQVPDPTAKLKVTITDANATQFFTKALRPNVSIARIGTAQYLKPVSMGSPKNFLGTGDLANIQTGFTSNFWLAISGGCASKENGDRIQAQTDANYTGTNNPPSGQVNWSACTGGSTIPNTEYDDNGYFYAVEFAADSPVPVTVQIFDAGYCTGGSTKDNGGGFTTTFQMLDNSSFDPLQSNPVGSALSGPSNGGATCGTWTNLYTIASPTKGTYFVNVQSATGSGGTQHGSNAFAIRAQRSSGSWSATASACASDTNEASPNVTNVTYVASCPQVHGYGNLGVYANLTGTSAEFYLAQLGNDYNNKQMELSLFDPGEGSRALQILDPLGQPVSFSWEVMCQNLNSAPCTDGTVAPTGGYSGTSSAFSFPTGGVGPGTTSIVNGLDLWGNESNGNSFNPQPGTHRASTSKYSDRLLKLTVQLPADLNAAFGGKQWYKIRYWVGSAPTDRTTWSVTINGAPVRLIPNP